MLSDGFDRQNHGSRIWLLAGLATALAAVTACERNGAGRAVAGADGKPVVYTTFYPTTYFARRIGGDVVDVVCPCPAEADPARWVPDERTIAAYQRADLIILNGASFEHGLNNVTLPPSRIVDTSKPLRDGLIQLTDTVTHTHGPRGAHSHEGIDGHTWLDPINAKIQAGEIRTALVRRYPAHQAAFEQRYAMLTNDLDALDARLRALAEKMAGEILLCAHPAYNYIGRRYGWQLKTYYLNPQTVPDERTLAVISGEMAGRTPRCILWESEPTGEVAGVLHAALGLTSIVFSPCEVLDDAPGTGSRDFLTVMNENVDRLQEMFGVNSAAEGP